MNKLKIQNHPFSFINFPKLFPKTLMVLALITQVIGFSSCQKLDTSKNKTLVELESICENIPIPNNYTFVNSEKSVDIGKVAVFKNFKSNDSCENTKEHFFNYFINSGWDRNRMEVEQTRGGMITLDFTFRTKNYVVNVSCQNDVAENSEKQIGFSCSWGLLK